MAGEQVREPSRRVHVLLVESDPEHAARVRAILEASEPSQRFRLTHVERFDSALNMLPQADYDVAILDLTLPDAQGLDTVTRAARIASGTTILVMTGIDDENLAIAAVRAGAQDYLVKGVTDLRLLPRVILQARERHHMIRQLEEARRRERHLATHDPLTDLPNRQLFVDRLEQAIAYAARYRDLLAVLFLDLDRFKPINDRLGHAAGDRALVEVARRLRSCVRESDTVCRFGGDEFLLLLRNVRRQQDASKVAENVLAALSAPLAFDDVEFHISASIGVTLFPFDGRDASALIRNADHAMYEVKKRHGHGVLCHGASGGVAESRRGMLAPQLQAALERREFRLHFQPQLDVPGSRLCGVEALVRWQHPELGLLAPSQFIPLSEETGFILPLGDWILEEMCRQGRAWLDRGYRPLRLAANLSLVQLADPDFPARLRRILEESGLPAETLALEVAEGGLFASRGRVLEALTALKALGVRLAIDGFGIGAASLSNLRELPADALKIARSFVQLSHRDARDAAIVSAIIDLAGEIGIEVLAEGVESGEQRDFLLSRGCGRMQGFLFGRPVPAEQIEPMLSRRPVYRLGSALSELHET